jgi:hypothetical protein
MFLSKKRKSISSEAPDTLEKSGLQKLLEIVSHKCIRLQSRVAAAMQKGSEHLSVTGKKLALIIFCLIGIAASVYVFTVNILYKKDLRHIPVSLMTIPKNVFENDNKTFETLPTVEYNKIETFTKYIDSLSNSISGQKVKDSILKFRPFLMDSIRQIETLYQIQEKNKK